MNDLDRKRLVDDPARDRLMSPDGEIAEGPDAPGGPADMLQSLQQAAGNSAVNSLFRGKARTRVSGGGAGKAGPPSGTGFESGLYEQSILGPLRAAYACVRDDPPDHELALQHLQRVGEALWDYEQRYRGSDDALANGFYAARGWLGRVARELTDRLGSAKPMSDATIARFVSDALIDLNRLEQRLH